MYVHVYAYIDSTHIQNVYAYIHYTLKHHSLRQKCVCVCVCVCVCMCGSCDFGVLHTAGALSSLLQKGDSSKAEQPRIHKFEVFTHTCVNTHTHTHTHTHTRVWQTKLQTHLTQKHSRTNHTHKDAHTYT